MINREVVFFMVFEDVFEDVFEEYLYHFVARGYTQKTMINKRQEYKNLKIYLKDERAITLLRLGLPYHHYKQKVIQYRC